MARYFGPNFPFIGGKENILSLQTDERLIKNDLLQLLLTVPGERVFRPDFGTLIRSFLFEQIEYQGLGVLQQNIKNAVAKYEQRVILSDVNIEVDADNNLVNIKLYGTFNFNKNIFNNIINGDLLIDLKLPMKASNPLN